MALDATPAGDAADSYLTLADADEMAPSLGLLGWGTKTQATREAALRLATLLIDSHRVHNPRPYSTTQKLVFPRAVDLVNGVPTIPGPVKTTCMLQAAHLAVVGETDQKLWEGKHPPSAGSPLCPRAFGVFWRFISKVGTFTE